MHRSKTLNNLEMDFSNEFTTVLMPSYYDPILNVLNALRARKAFTKVILMLTVLSKTKLTIEKTTIRKSRMLK